MGLNERNFGFSTWHVPNHTSSDHLLGMAMQRHSNNDKAGADWLGHGNAAVTRLADKHNSRNRGTWGCAALICSLETYGTPQ